MCKCRLVLVDDRLKCIHKAHRDLDARDLLAEVEFADLSRLIRVDDDKPRLVHDDKLTCPIGRHLRKGIVKARESDGSRNHAHNGAVIYHRNADDGDNLAGDRRDHRLRDDGFLCLDSLLKIIAIRTVDLVAVRIESNSIETKIGYIREDLSMLLHLLQCNQLSRIISVQNGLIA